ncbi:MAG TPA: RidA family protein [Woeseiaceae bacterium]|nr:RidA family protein [Woeseiaceae bacterium]
MESIFTEHAPPPNGHYSQAMVAGNLVFVSGQLPIRVVAENRADDSKAVGGIEQQTRIALENVQSILESCNSSLAQVIKTTIYISDISQWGLVDKVYAEFFGSHRPARAVVPTRELHYGYQIEIEAIASLSAREPDR